MAEEKVSELLACPLCAERMLLEQFVDWEERPLPVQHIIHSKPSTCPLASFMFEATDEAIERWNRRTPTPVTEDVPWPGRQFCETAERNVSELAKWVKGEDDKQVALDAGLALRTLLSASPSPPKADGPGEDGWQPIETAPKDGTPIWVLLRDDIYPTLRPEREDLSRWNGLQLCVSHPGTYERDGRTWDHGWNMAAPVGNGGYPDEWIVGWRPLPASPFIKREA